MTRGLAILFLGLLAAPLSAQSGAPNRQVSCSPAVDVRLSLTVEEAARTFFMGASQSDYVYQIVNFAFRQPNKDEPPVEGFMEFQFGSDSDDVSVEIYAVDFTKVGDQTEITLSACDEWRSELIAEFEFFYNSDFEGSSQDSEPEPTPEGPNPDGGIRA